MSKVKPQLFSEKSFFKNVFTSYFFPLIMSGGPAYFLDKPDLLKASYSTIALPSLIATVVSFLLLKYFYKKQLFKFHRIIVSLFLLVLIGLLSLLTIHAFDLWASLLNILPSASLGAVIIGMTNPLNKN